MENWYITAIGGNLDVYFEWYLNGTINLDSTDSGRNLDAIVFWGKFEYYCFVRN